MKKTLMILFAILFNFAIAIMASGIFEYIFDVQISWVALGVAINILSLRSEKVTRHIRYTGLLYVGINKEIWLDELKEAMIPDDSFLVESKDMSQWVDNDVINLGEAGVDPAVLINNTSYPVAFAARTDSPIALPLDVYDTEGTVIRNAEKAELVYDKMASVVKQHKNAIAKTIAKKAAHAWSPSSNATNTPVLLASGAAGAGSLLAITLNDIIDMSDKFNGLDIPSDGRICVLNPKHLASLRKEDKALFNQLIPKEGGVFMLYGFKVYSYSKTPVYHKSTGAKIAYGTAPGANDAHASIFYHKDEVMKALGSEDMFSRLNDPEQKGDIINFQKRGLVLPIRALSQGAIYSGV